MSEIPKQNETIEIRKSGKKPANMSKSITTNDLKNTLSTRDIFLIVGSGGLEPY
jgi:hypothetical protein